MTNTSLPSFSKVHRRKADLPSGLQTLTYLRLVAWSWHRLLQGTVCTS